MINRRKVGTTSSHHGPYGQGYTRATMGGTEGCQAARRSESQKAARSPDWSLQLDSMKSESLVIANQHAGLVVCVQGPGTYSPQYADLRLLAILRSCRRVSACKPTGVGFGGISSSSRFGSPLYRPL